MNKKNSFIKVYAVISIQAAYALILKAKKSGRIALYIETSGDNPVSDEIEYIWISTSPSDPVARIKVQSRIMRIIDMFLKWMLVSENIEKILFDGGKICSFFHNNGIKLNGKLFDVLASHNILSRNSGAPISENLNSLVKYYIDIDYEEQNKNTSPIGNRRHGYRYQMADNMKAMHLLKEKQHKELTDKKLADIAENEFERIRAASCIQPSDRLSYFNKERYSYLESIF